MKTSIKNHIGSLFVICTLFSCSKRTLSPEPDYDSPSTEEKNFTPTSNLTYVALGDSYTIGTSVAYQDNYPSQLSTALQGQLKSPIALKIVAKNGWRTDNLLDALKTEQLEPNYDLVTLLIGVNNQYQSEPFKKYEKEFSQLLEQALELANHKTERVFVISIPDWGFTPYGSGWDQQKISQEIDAYNSFAKETAEKEGVTFIEVTDITRKGLEDKELVASDGLHPSKKAYKLFVERMLPIITSSLKN